MASPVLDAYADYLLAQDALRKAVDEHLHTADDAELVRLLRAHHRLEARQDSIGSDLLWEACARDLPHRHGATSPATWLAALLTMRHSTADDRVRTTLAMERVCPATYDRLRDGDISFGQAAAIASVVTDLPKGVTEQQTARAERYLLERSPSPTPWNCGNCTSGSRTSSTPTDCSTANAAPPANAT